MVTLVFAIFEHMQLKVDLKNQEDWSPKQLKEQEARSSHNIDKGWNPLHLSPVPDKRAVINRGETLIGILFLLIVSVIFVFAPRLLGAYIFEDNELLRTIPIFNMDKWNILCPLLLSVLMIGFIDEIIKLITGCYNTLVLISCLVTNSIQLVIATIVLKFLPLWNVNFVTELSEAFDYTPTSKGDIFSYWGTDTPSNIILAIIFICTVIEISVTTYKTIHYKTLSNL